MASFSFHSHLEASYRPQRTIKAPVVFSGIGIHTGALVTMRFCPSDPGTGIVFKRTDLPSQPVIPATIEYVCDTARNTTIGVGNVRVHTIEHVMAALSAFHIDNLCVELNNIEPPVGNGSSDVFVEMIEQAGWTEQGHTVPIVKVKQPVYFSENNIHLVALPSDEYRISYTLNYPNSSVLRAQFQSFQISRSTFKQELAPCRTFSLYEEVSTLMDKGLIKGGSLSNAVIIKEDAIFSRGGLVFPDEMVRHKILDMVGDLALVGFDFLAHIIAIRSGHASNYAFAKKLYNSITMENC
jgi:UDP-3-O-[3-hydroxymyristoyl] N-acetylglucosamine deacetylase